MRMSRRGLEKSAREALYGSRLFFPARECYQFFLDRRRLAFRRRMRGFYSPFVRRGDLVFDVGANIGLYSEVFSQLGAKVVAVEPNPRCCERLDRLARSCQVHIERCAAGAAPGEAELHLCENPGLSTLTARWLEAARRSVLHRDAGWTGTITVQVLTLDQLAQRHGIPCFVKVDAEGYDDQVLRGMSFRPEALSFEFNREIPEVALSCLDTPVLADGYEFNFVWGLEMRLVSHSWMCADWVRHLIGSSPSFTEYGDVVARRVH